MFERVKTRRKLSSLFLAAFMTGIAVPAYAQFVSIAGMPSNSFSTATLQSPTELSASASCDGADTAKITLGWTATPSSFADGYDVYRSSLDGGPYTKIDHVNGGTTTSHNNLGLAMSTTYFYVVQSTASNWTSINSSQAQATTPATCP